ncbi:hypothetical protein NA78x_004185 [Anatilimnocola sp. NA78]|uniref:hypothetical protein n=1 Tax=Anatilimnocola sp. NA78 TaxID=3415683 RepID=UPI003CE51A66
MLIRNSEVSAFIEFLRKKCRSNQVTIFTPSPNENGEFFRAVAEGQFVVAHLAANDQVEIVTAEKYAPSLESRWQDHQRAAMPPTGSLLSRCLSMILPVGK